MRWYVGPKGLSTTELARYTPLPMWTVFLPVFYAVLQILILISIGVVMRRFLGFDKSFFQRLSTLVVSIALPLYFFVRFAEVDLDALAGAWLLPVAALANVAISLLFAAVLFRFLPLERAEKRAGVALAGFGNSGYMPLALIEILPLSVAAVGLRYGVELPAVYVGAYVFAYSPVLWSVGNLIISGGKEPFRWQKLISPPMYGMLAGLIVPVFGLQAALADPGLPFFHIDAALTRAADLTLPLVLITLGGVIGGLELPEGMKRRLWTMAGAVAVQRFLVLPGVFYALYFTVLKPMAAPAVLVWVLFLETHTPPATNLSVMASRAGVNEEYTGFSLLLTYVMYLVVLPVYLIVFLNLSG